MINSQEFLIKHRWTMGRGLLDGSTESGACGDFNSAFAFIAKHVFNIPLITGNGVHGQTMIGGNFITMPHTHVIDSHWDGNVWSDSADNDDIRAFEFYGHYFCYYAGRIYDVTCNQTFTSVDDMIWCELESVTPDVAVRYGGAESVYRVIQKRRTDIQSRSYCIKIGREQLATGSGGFSNWILTDRSELAPLEIRRFSMRSSRS